MSIWITFKYEYVHFVGESHANFKRFWKRSRTQQRPTFLILQTRKLRPQEGSASELMVLLKARTLTQISWKQFCCLFYLGLLQTTCCQILDQTLNWKFFENVLHLLTKRQTQCSKKILSLQPWTVHLSSSIILRRVIQAETFKCTHPHSCTNTQVLTHTGIISGMSLHCLAYIAKEGRYQWKWWIICAGWKNWSRVSCQVDHYFASCSAVLWLWLWPLPAWVWSTRHRLEHVFVE